MLKVLAASFVLALSPMAAHAASAPAEDSEKDSSRAIDVLNLITPVVVDGRLTNYLFLSLRIQLNPRIDRWAARAKGHFLRDALLKTTHREKLTNPSDPETLNEAATIAAITRASNEVLGPGSVRTVEILGVTALNATHRGRR